ncbi:MAG: hypothetical protein ACIAQU_04145, partial [Phycisphaerales bacterium JB064]
MTTTVKVEWCYDMRSTPGPGLPFYAEVNGVVEIVAKEPGGRWLVMDGGTSVLINLNGVSRWAYIPIPSAPQPQQPEEDAAKREFEVGDAYQNEFGQSGKIVWRGDVEGVDSVIIKWDCNGTRSVCSRSSLKPAKPTPSPTQLAPEERAST